MNEQDVPNIDSKSPSTLPKRHTSQPQQLTSEMPSGRTAFPAEVLPYVVVAFGGDDHESFPAGRHFRAKLYGLIRV